MVLYIYSVRLHKIANFHYWIIFKMAASPDITGFFSRLNSYKIDILLNVQLDNFQFSHISCIFFVYHYCLPALLAGAIECCGLRRWGCCGV